MSAERVEYRLTGERDGYGAWEGSPDTRDLAAVQREAKELARRNKFVRIQKRTVIESDWRDIPEQGREAIADG